MKKYFSIGEMAKLNYISTHTLRYYDRINLLKPSYIEEATGYRYYTYEDFLFLDTIQYLKLFHMSLTEIKAQFENRSIENTLKVYKNQVIVLDAQMEAMKNIKKRILHNINNLNESKLIFENKKKELKFYPERYVMLIDDTVSTDEEYEVVIRKLSHHLYSENFRFMGDFMSMKSKELLEAGVFETTMAIGNMMKSRPGGKEYRTIPPSEYACMYHTGPSERIGESYEELLLFIKESGRKIIGDAIELFEIDLMDTKNPNEYITHIEIPVSG